MDEVIHPQYKKTLVDTFAILHPNTSPRLLVATFEFFLRSYMESSSENGSKPYVDITAADLAKKLGVNHNTAAKALRNLEQYGVLYGEGFYGRKYRFPNGSLEKSLYAPIASVESQLTSIDFKKSAE